MLFNICIQLKASEQGCYVCKRFVLGSNVHNPCVLHLYIGICSVQSSMSYNEKQCRKKSLLLVVI